jgi:hypothetical protein
MFSDRDFSKTTDRTRITVLQCARTFESQCLYVYGIKNSNSNSRDRAARKRICCAGGPTRKIRSSVRIVNTSARRTIQQYRRTCSNGVPTSIRGPAHNRIIRCWRLRTGITCEGSKVELNGRHTRPFIRLFPLSFFVPGKPSFSSSVRVRATIDRTELKIICDTQARRNGRRAYSLPLLSEIQQLLPPYNLYCKT